MSLSSFRLPYREIPYVRRFGLRLVTQEFELYWVKREKPPQRRWKIFVPKRVVAKAHERNRLKRLVTEALRQLFATYKIQGNLLIIVKMPLPKIKTQDIKILLERELKGLG